MVPSDQPGAVGQQFFELVDQEIAFVIDRRPFDDGAMAFPEEMPGHDIGMVLHDREHDLVARLHMLTPERVGDEVDRLGGVAGEDDLLGPPCIDEGPHLLARALIGLGRGIGEKMQAAMHVGIFRGVGLVDAVEHHLRLLRRGRIVEIDERLAVDLHGEDRKILAHAGDVIAAIGQCGMHGLSMSPAYGRAASHARVASIRASRAPSCPTPSIASATKDWISNASASRSGMPRAIR